MEENQENKKLKDILYDLTLHDVPAYANKFFYSLGFLAMVTFVLLVISGLIMVFFGPNWWLTANVGIFVRSIHLWAAQAFIVFIILHLIIVFLTSGFKGPRKLTWVLGALMFFFALFEAEFGYGLRDDFSSQWRTLSAADFYNGSGLGAFINNLNYAQIYGIHIVLIPLIILVLLASHYLLVKVRGLAKPYLKDCPVKMVKANHKTLFARGIILTVVIFGLAFAFRAPLILPTTISFAAKNDPSLVAETLIAEFNRTSDTATYLDNIDPYQYDTREIYIIKPYKKYLELTTGQNILADWLKLNSSSRVKDIDAAKSYFKNNGAIVTSLDKNNPFITVIGSLVTMAQSGLYQDWLNGSEAVGNLTYSQRFLSDTGIIKTKAKKLGITTKQYGMVREENGAWPPGAWWLAPLGFLDNTVLANDPNQDRDGAEILGVLMLIFIAFPYIPGLSRIPEKLNLAKFFWRTKNQT